MLDWLGVASPDSGQERLLSALLVVVAALFVVTVIFSAYAIMLRLRHAARDRRRVMFAERWRDRLLIALADPNEIEPLRKTIGEEDRIHFVGFAVQYARRMRGDGRIALRAMVKPYLSLVAGRADARSLEVRARAIQTLGMLGLPEYAPRVKAALDDPSDLVAMVAARALALEESADYAEAVLSRLDRFAGWNRRFLASMLAAMGPGVAAALRAGLADPQGTPRARAVLAEALQLQGDLASADVAVGLLGAEKDRDLLAAALRLLREVGRPEHAAAVREHIAADDPVVRAQALHTLGVIGAKENVDDLVSAMNDRSPWAALSAARGALAAGGVDRLSQIAESGRETAIIARQVLEKESVA